MSIQLIDGHRLLFRGNIVRQLDPNTQYTITTSVDGNGNFRYVFTTKPGEFKVTIDDKPLNMHLLPTEYQPKQWGKNPASWYNMPINRFYLTVVFAFGLFSLGTIAYYSIVAAREATLTKAARATQATQAAQAGTAAGVGASMAALTMMAAAQPTRSAGANARVNAQMAPTYDNPNLPGIKVVSPKDINAINALVDTFPASEDFPFRYTPLTNTALSRTLLGPLDGTMLGNYFLVNPPAYNMVFPDEMSYLNAISLKPNSAYEPKDLASFIMTGTKWSPLLTNKSILPSTVPLANMYKYMSESMVAVIQYNNAASVTAAQNMTPQEETNQLNRMYLTSSVLIDSCRTAALDMGQSLSADSYRLTNPQRISEICDEFLQQMYSSKDASYLLKQICTSLIDVMKAAPESKFNMLFFIVFMFKTARSYMLIEEDSRPETDLFILYNLHKNFIPDRFNNVRIDWYAPPKIGTVSEIDTLSPHEQAMANLRNTQCGNIVFSRADIPMTIFFNENSYGACYQGDNLNGLPADYQSYLKENVSRYSA